METMTRLCLTGQNVVHHQLSDNVLLWDQERRGGGRMGFEREVRLQEAKPGGGVG